MKISNQQIVLLKYPGAFASKGLDKRWTIWNRWNSFCGDEISGRFLRESQAWADAVKRIAATSTPANSKESK